MAFLPPPVAGGIPCASSRDAAHSFTALSSEPPRRLLPGRLRPLPPPAAFELPLLLFDERLPVDVFDNDSWWPGRLRRRGDHAPHGRRAAGSGTADSAGWLLWEVCRDELATLDWPAGAHGGTLAPTPTPAARASTAASCFRGGNVRPGLELNVAGEWVWRGRHRALRRAAHAP